MTLHYRAARLDDTETLAALFHQASCGMADFLLNDLFDGLNCNELIKMAIADENAPMSYCAHIVAEQVNQVIGAINYYPAESHQLPDTVHSLIPAHKIERFVDFYTIPLENSLYLHSIATTATQQRQRIATGLYEHLQAIATTQGYTCLLYTSPSPRDRG